MKRSAKDHRKGLVFVVALVICLCGVSAAAVLSISDRDPSLAFPTSLQRARRLLDEGRIADAQKIFEEALKKNAKDVEAVRGLAQCAIENGDDEAAMGLLHQLTTLVPKERGAWRKLALCASRLGRDMEALSAAQTALSLAPEGDRGMSDLVSRLITKKSMLEGGMAGDQMPGEGLPGRGLKSGSVDPMGGVRLPEIPDPSRNLPTQGRDR